MRQSERLTPASMASGPDALVRVINKNLEFFSRETTVYSSGVLAAGAYSNFTLSLGKTVRIITVVSNVQGTLRIYGSAADRDADTRLQLILSLLPVSGGVLGGIVHNLDNPLSTAMYCRLLNTGSSSASFNLSLVSLQLEV